MCSLHGKTTSDMTARLTFSFTIPVIPAPTARSASIFRQTCGTLQKLCRQRRLPNYLYKHANADHSKKPIRISPKAARLTNADKNSIEDEAPPEIPPAPPGIFWVAALTELLTGVVALMLCKLTGINPLGPKFQISLNQVVKAIQIFVPFSILFWIMEKAIPSNVQRAIDKRFRSFFDDRWISSIFVFCTFVAIGEELLFRGWLLPWFSSIGLPGIWPVLLSAIVFGALHAYTKLYMLMASVAGALLGFMYVQTGSLLHPLIVHFIYDFATIMMLKMRWRARRKSVKTRT